MAEVNKEQTNEEVTDQVKKSEPSDKLTKETPKAKTKSKPAPKPKKLKPYVHIDTFLQTAVPYYGLSKMQAAGFKSLMAGKHYQRDEQVFVEELKKYLNIK